MAFQLLSDSPHGREYGFSGIREVLACGIQDLGHFSVESETQWVLKSGIQLINKEHPESH